MRLSSGGHTVLVPVPPEPGGRTSDPRSRMRIAMVTECACRVPHHPTMALGA
jgi:hypothetical protein